MNNCPYCSWVELYRHSESPQKWKYGKWRPFNPDGTEHDCKKKKVDTTKVNGVIKEIKKQNQRMTLTFDEIVRRLKSIGIDTDFDIFLRSTDSK